MFQDVLPKGWTMGNQGHLNIKMLSYRYRSSYHKDKMISWQSYLYNGTILGKTIFILRQGSVPVGLIIIGRFVFSEW